MGLFTRDNSSADVVPEPADESTDMALYRAKALPYNSFRPLTASAVRIKLTDGLDLSNLRRRRMEDKVWQEDAWNAYDAIGEIKYAFNLTASVASRVRLYVAVVSDEGRTPTSVEDTPDLTPGLALASTKSLDRLFRGASQGISQMIRNMILNLSVAGECLLVQIPARLSTGTPESWEIRSVDEVVMAGDGRTVMLRARQGISTLARDIQKLPPEAFVGRIWRSHARWSDEPDSSLRSVLDLCSELLLLNRTFRATARSRLNAGALFIPDGLSAAADSDVHDISDINPDTGEPVFMPVEDTDAFEEELLEAMTLPIQDESSASAVVPLLIRGPSELGEAIKQFKFERSFDPSLAQRADRVLERILQGLDVPKEVVTGIAGIKYANATQIDENLYKAHIEPLILLICDALTSVYLHPALLALGFNRPQVERVLVWYDPSDIVTRPNKSDDAKYGYEKNLISGQAWRKVHGFSDSDAPQSKETLLRTAVERGILPPELVQQLLYSLAPDLLDKLREEQQASSPAPLPQDVENILKG